MGFLLKQVYGLIKLLNSDKATGAIALGVVCGMVMGFSPGFSLQMLLIFVCLFFFRIQMGAAFLSAAFFKLFAYLLDPVFHKVGTVVLEMDSLNPLFTTLYGMPIVPFTKFYNTVVMGAGITALLLSPFVYFISKALIAKYRETIYARYAGSKFFKWLKATQLYNWYEKYEALRG